MKMKRLGIRFAGFLAGAIISSHAIAGTVFYAAIPATDSDAGSGISTSNVYTSAVSGGNTSGTNMVVNGVTLYALAASGSSSSANNVFLNATTGALTNAGGTASSIQADGALAQALSSMTFNQDAQDGSQQEIALDPASLTAGKTYDLRIYFCNSSGQKRLVELSFAGDGQAAVDTGSFNEDDATTSAGGFSDQNQVYYIDYRYTWDGDTTPGITITQSSGSTPFCLYALTNQEVAGGAAGGAGAVGAAGGAGAVGAAGGAGAVGAAGGAGAASSAGAAGGAGAASSEGSATSAGSTDLRASGASAGSEEGGAEGGGNAGIATTEQVDTASQSDAGAESEDFYNCDCLSQHGTWITVTGYGTCWQPSDCGADWQPYTRGHWGYSTDCGYTWISNENEEDWGWACYHYGRWGRCEGRGWFWSPGRVWAPAWVSWRTGEDSCGCVGWAPLPPECTCSVDAGVSTWVDNQWGMGPGCYNFCDVSNLGSEDLSRVVYSREDTVNIFSKTTNITNISYNRNSRTFFTGGPNYQKMNSLISKRGGKPIPSVVVDRRPSTLLVAGGKHSQMHGNVLSLAAPNVMPAKKITSRPKPAATIPAAQVDHGWKQVKDPKVVKALKARIAQEANGKTPKNTHAKLPPEAAKAALTHPMGTPVSHPGVTLKKAGPSPGAAGMMHPGVTLKKAGPSTGAAGMHPGVTLKKAGPSTGAAGMHPGVTLKNAGPGAGAGVAQPTPKVMLHPGKSLKQAGTSAATTGNPGKPSGTTGLHPGAKSAVSSEKGVNKPTPPEATSKGLPGQPAGTPALHPGKTKKHPGNGLNQPTPAAKTSEETPGQPAGTPAPHLGKTKKHPGKGANQPAPAAKTSEKTPGQPAGTPAPHLGKTKKHPGRGVNQPAPPEATSEGIPASHPRKQKQHIEETAPSTTRQAQGAEVRHPEPVEKHHPQPSNPPQRRQIEQPRPQPQPQPQPQPRSNIRGKGTPTPGPR